MNKTNYQRELDKVLASLPDRNRRLFLHSCCAPCSSYCLEYLRAYFRITVFYYNPNITMPEEYRLRAVEQKRLIQELNQAAGNPISYLEGDYDPAVFLEMARGLEKCPEGGERCFKCYELRLKEAARLSARPENKYDYFTTTLTISPLKDAQMLNAIGRRLGEEYGVAWLPSDFKKNNGYRRSVELSREHGLYRQAYCGCAFSKAERR